MKDYIPNLVQIYIFTIFVFFTFCIGGCAGEINSLSESPNDDVLADIVNPFNSTCYDWRGTPLHVTLSVSTQNSCSIDPSPIPALLTTKTAR